MFTKYCEDVDLEPDDDTVVIKTKPSSQVLGLVTWICLFVFHLQAAYRVSNAAINSIFRFFSALFRVLSTFVAQLKEIVLIFPNSRHIARKFIGNQLTFTRYSVCRKCFSIYPPEQRRDRFKKCSFRQYPNHPHQRMRQECGTLILKTVEKAGGKYIYYPFLVYCYLGLEPMLRLLLQQETFSVMSEKWRERAEDDYYHDVYDGKVWKDFCIAEGQNFLSEPNNFGLALNIDFFQPYKHVQYSVGGFYCVILNLPRRIRYKQENVLLVALSPGPKEPEHDLNKYLEPFVNELMTFWCGKEITVNGVTKCYKMALMNVACDLPAGRKVCGFLSYSAAYGCSKCLKKFTGSVGCMDYSGFDRNSWVPRCGRSHRQVGRQMRSFRTASERSKQESESGVRYSILLELPYFDAPRMLSVDPMHNLFLGTSKHVLHKWIERNILSSESIRLIQEEVDTICIPAGIGRIPYKIASGFSSFSADQWKNWTIYYSLIVLHDKLPAEHLECWRHFVLGCRKLLGYKLSKMDILMGDGLLMQFCRRYERMYGRDSVTPNMHMHAHLKSCIEDYGPLHGFWLYAFERYNGILENMPNNNRCIEPQLMQRFIEDTTVQRTPFPEVFSSDLKPHVVDLRTSDTSGQKRVVGSLADTIFPFSFQDSSSCYKFEGFSDLELASSRSLYILSATQCEELTQLYSKLTSVPLSQISVPSSCWNYPSLSIQGKIVGSSKSRSKASSIVGVTWQSDIFGSPEVPMDEPSPINDPSFDHLRPTLIDAILVHRPVINGKPCSFVLVVVSWYKFHPEINALGKPLTIWCSNIFEEGGIYSIIPALMIKCRLVSSKIDLNGETVMCVCPCINF